MIRPMPVVMAEAAPVVANKKMDWETIHRAIPFIGLIGADVRGRPTMTRIIEQAIPGIAVGIAVAMLGIWKSDAVQDQEIRVVSGRIDQIELDRKESRKDLNLKLETIDKKLDDLRREIYRK